jgi:hypothetical protein
MIALIAGAVAVVVVAAVVVVKVVAGPGAPATGFVPTGSTPAQDAAQITTAFLQAWETRDYAKAANYTDHPAAAQAALIANTRYLNLKKMTGSAGNVTAATATATATTPQMVTFGVDGHGDRGAAGHLELPLDAHRLPEDELERLVRRLEAGRDRAEPHRDHPPGGGRRAPAGGLRHRRQR